MSAALVLACGTSICAVAGRARVIRKGYPEDFDQILLLCERFWQETEFDDPFEPQQSFFMLNMAYNHGILAVVEIEDKIVGFSAGIKSPLLGNGQVFSGVELAWWINPEHRAGTLGSKLFDFMEDLAKKAGVKYWCMVSLQSSMPEKVNKFYERKGYHLSEQTYMRCLWP
jgi:GNAT superfamily N-acetyltransferase